jgi:hypothetical protein
MTDTGGHGDIAKLLRDTAKAIRPHIEAALDLTEIFADYRKAVTDAGGDWMALKNLVKAQVQDERDDSGEGKHVARIIEKADFAASYADMLGLGGAKMNEIKFISAEDAALIAEAIDANADHLPDAGNMVSDTENESRPATSIPRREALRDDAQPEGGMTGGSRPDQASEELDTRSASLMGTTSARHVADESRASLLDANGFFTEPLPSYARQRG